MPERHWRRRSAVTSSTRSWEWAWWAGRRACSTRCCATCGPLSDTTSGPLKLTPAELAKLEAEHFIIARQGTRKVIVFDSNGEIRALDAKCTHEGCTVQFVQADGGDRRAPATTASTTSTAGCSRARRRGRSTQWAVSKEGETITLTPGGGVSATKAPASQRAFSWLDERFGVEQAGGVGQAQGGAGRRPLDGLVLPGRHHALLLHRADRLRRAALDVLPGGRGDLVRVDSLPHHQGALRLAGALDALLERAPDDHLADHPHVQHHAAEGVPQATRADLAHRLRALRRGARASASRATCCRGTSWPSSPPRWAPTR